MSLQETSLRTLFTQVMSYFRLCSEDFSLTDHVPLHYRARQVIPSPSKPKVNPVPEAPTLKDYSLTHASLQRPKGAITQELSLFTFSGPEFVRSHFIKRPDVLQGPKTHQDRSGKAHIYTQCAFIILEVTSTDQESAACVTTFCSSKDITFKIKRLVLLDILSCGCSPWSQIMLPTTDLAQSWLGQHLTATLSTCPRMRSVTGGSCISGPCDLPSK